MDEFAEWMKAQPFMYRGLFVFFAYVVLDFVWAKYTIALAKEYPVYSANWSMAIAVTALGAVYFVTHDLALVFFAAAGGWLGTYVAVRYKLSKHGD